MAADSPQLKSESRGHLKKQSHRAKWEARPIKMHEWTSVTQAKMTLMRGTEFDANNVTPKPKRADTYRDLMCHRGYCSIAFH